VLVHLSVDMAVTGAKLGFVIILAVDALIVSMLLTVSANHIITTHRPYFSMSQINFAFFQNGNSQLVV
jgi:hypothetical protein